MSLQWKFLGSLCLATFLIGQSEDVLPNEPAQAASLKAISDPAKSPAENHISPTSRLPEIAPAPTVLEFERSCLQPTAVGRVLIGGQWVSPQLLLGSVNELPSANLSEIQQPVLADGSFQPASNTQEYEQATGLDDVFEGKLVKRYSEARVVRFLAPREPLENLFNQIGLDDLNRYQFRRNRSDKVPVERV
jgi:hypothetical protein|tara:strand:- start:6044 stop:6616 length:573 start_codon:yes stop_codon:yes gene_type:complete